MMLIAYAATHALPISHIDFSSAFLQGDELDETIFMRLPKMGFEEQRIVRLLRPLYGLVQAGRKWHNSGDGKLDRNTWFRQMLSRLVPVHQEVCQGVHLVCNAC